MTIPIILVILQINVTTEKDACQGFLGLKMLWTVKLGKRRFQSSSDYRLGAGEGIRTLDILLGKQALCRLSYTRLSVGIVA